MLSIRCLGPRDITSTTNVGFNDVFDGMFAAPESAFWGWSLTPHRHHYHHHHHHHPYRDSTDRTPRFVEHRGRGLDGRQEHLRQLHELGQYRGPLVLHQRHPPVHVVGLPPLPVHRLIGRVSGAGILRSIYLSVLIIVSSMVFDNLSYMYMRAGRPFHPWMASLESRATILVNFYLDEFQMSWTVGDGGTKTANFPFHFQLYTRAQKNYTQECKR